MIAHRETLRSWSTRKTVYCEETGDSLFPGESFSRSKNENKSLTCVRHSFGLNENCKTCRDFKNAWRILCQLMLQGLEDLSVRMA